MRKLFAFIRRPIVMLVAGAAIAAGLKAGGVPAPVADVVGQLVKSFASAPAPTPEAPTLPPFYTSPKGGDTDGKEEEAVHPDK